MSFVFIGVQVWNVDCNAFALCSEKVGKSFHCASVFKNDWIAQTCIKQLPRRTNWRRYLYGLETGLEGNILGVWTDSNLIIHDANQKGWMIFPKIGKFGVIRENGIRHKMLVEVLVNSFHELSSKLGRYCCIHIMLYRRQWRPKNWICGKYSVALSCRRHQNRWERDSKSNVN